MYWRSFVIFPALWTLQVRPGQAAPSFRLMSSSQESDAEFDARSHHLTIGVSVLSKVNFSGTLPILTEQTLTAGSSGRFVLRQNSWWHIYSPCFGYLYSVLIFFNHIRIYYTSGAHRVLSLKLFSTREWVICAQWTWCPNHPLLPLPWGLAGGSMTTPSPPGMHCVQIGPIETFLLFWIPIFN